MHSKQFINKMKDRLLDERDRLAEEVLAVQESTDIDDDDGRETIGEEIDDASKDIIDQLDRDIKDIDEALERIKKGTYGLCSIDGIDISETRLEVIPWATTCTEHASV